MEIRPVVDDDLEQELDLRVRAFGPLGGYRERVTADNLADTAAGRMLGAYEGGRLLGTARYLDMRQWWGGRVMPMAGVAGVKTAPEARGRGVATALLTEMLAFLPGRGYPVSVLYPSTASLYRSLGWEFGGGFYRTEIVGPALASLLPPELGAGDGEVRLRRAGGDDAAEALAVIGAVLAASRDCGPSTFGVDEVRQDLAEEDQFSYLADDGFLSYGFDGGSRAIEVGYFAAGSAATARALWGILGSHSTVTRTVTAFLGPHNPLGWLVRGRRDLDVRLDKRWMLRVLDPVAAVAGRGFPVGVSASVHLRLTDAVLSANSGEYQLTIADGTGSLARTDGPGAGDALLLGSRGLAALYAGIPVSTLRVAGLASGGDAGADARLDSAFACASYMTDSF